MKHVLWPGYFVCVLLAMGCGDEFEDAPIPGSGNTAGTGGGQGGAGGQTPDAGADGDADGSAFEAGEDVTQDEAGQCSAGYGDCDEDPANGCETALDTTDDCGACGKTCQAGQQCTNYLCQLTCTTGTGDCDEDPANGCETDTTSASGHCGACGSACGGENGSGVCADSTCTLDCNPGWGDCDGDEGNGCETETSADVANCGTCGTACTAGAHATAACVSGKCEMQCEEGWGDCDQNPLNGCETDISTDGDNCGLCGKACEGQQLCMNSICQLSCSGAMGDCDSEPGNGCETDLTSTPAHCSACGQACPAGGHGTATCTNSVCGIDCSAGWGNCDGDLANGCEVNVASDALNCGGCGTACPAGAHGTRTCSNSTCGIVCSAGWGNCDGSLSNGCEVNTTQSVDDCGYCGNVCPIPAHAAATCASGACGYSCLSGWDDCNGAASDGCEVNLSSNTSHCGGCDAACGADNGTATCSGGKCSLSCTLGFADCDGVNPNGCEADLSDDPHNCGACGHDCQGGSCSNGLCEAWVLATVAAEPRNIAVSATHVYWTTPSAVQGVPRTGGTVTNLATGQPSPYGIAVDDTHVYFTNYVATGNIMRVELSGAILTTLVSAESPNHVALDQDSIYYGDGAAVRRRSKNSSFSPYFAAQSPRNPGRIVVDSEYVYFVSPGVTDGVLRRDSIAQTDDPVTLAGSLRIPSDLAADDTHLYYVQVNVGGIAQVPKSGGTVIKIGDSSVSAVAVDDTDIFFSEDDNGRVMQVAKAGGSPIVRRTGAENPYKMEVRDGVVYWIERGSYQILAMVK